MLHKKRGNRNEKAGREEAGALGGGGSETAHRPVGAYGKQAGI